MKKDVVILIAEDDEGHFGLIKRNLIEAGLTNEILHFADGQAILDFLFRRGDGPHRSPAGSYLLILDIRMPKVDGTEVLKDIKEDEELCKLPVIMITTTDDPQEIEKCHALGCSSYITKPIEYNKFMAVVKQLGLYLSIVQIPQINGELTN
jgi:CheY-like chemotaxis protein